MLTADSSGMGTGGVSSSTCFPSLGNGSTASRGEGIRRPRTRAALPCPSTGLPFAIHTSPLRRPSTTVKLELRAHISGYVRISVAELRASVVGAWKYEREKSATGIGRGAQRRRLSASSGAETVTERVSKRGANEEEKSRLGEAIKRYERERLWVLKSDKKKLTISIH